MSGGYFDYRQHNLTDDAERLDGWIKEHGKDFSPQTVLRLNRLSRHLAKTAQLMRVADLLLCCDIGEETFNERWVEDVEVDDVGARLRKLRQSKKLTIRQLAGYAGLSQGFICDIENNNTQMSLDSAVRIAKGLGVEVTDLLKQTLI